MESNFTIHGLGRGDTIGFAQLPLICDTPRPLIQAIVDVMQPGPEDVVCDPACGTGGFLLATYDYIVRENKTLTREQKKHLKLDALRGVELVPSVARLCAMNLLLHGIGPSADEGAPPVESKDSLTSDPGTRYSMVLTNPPFGKKSNVMVVRDEGDEGREALTIMREDFWATTSNKQLNFMQHVKTILAMQGRAAVVVPDNGEPLRLEYRAHDDGPYADSLASSTLPPSSAKPKT